MKRSYAYRVPHSHEQQLRHTIAELKTENGELKRKNEELERKNEELEMVVWVHGGGPDN